MKTLLMVLQIVPLLIEVIRSVDRLIPVGGYGKEKLALVKAMLETAFNGITDIWPILEVIIAKVVAIANVTGAFKTDEKGKTIS